MTISYGISTNIFFLGGGTKIYNLPKIQCKFTCVLGVFGKNGHKILHMVCSVKCVTKSVEIFREHSPKILDPKNLDLNFAISWLFRT